MSELVPSENHGEVAVLTVTNPPVNALSPGVPEGLRDGVLAALADDAIKAIVIIGANDQFIAGADIKGFGALRSAASSGGESVGLNPVLDVLEGSSKPIVAALAGNALGGGLEFAMACHHRVAVATAKVGQPEVQLGLIPGAGGTQRLPRLAGVPKAVEMCAQGAPIGAGEAQKLGIIDAVVEGDLLEGAIAAARELAASGEPPRRTCDLTDKLGDEKSNAMIFQMARQMAAKQAKGMLAPGKAIDAVEAATQLPFAEGIKREQELFVECLQSSQCTALIHIFFGQRAVGKVPSIPKDTPTYDIKSVAIVGAGTMGGGIAMVYANAGISVVLKEVKQEFLERGMETIKKNYAARVKKGRLKQEKMDQRMALIKPTLTYDDFSDVDIVVEAAFEDMAIKKQVFSELDRVCKPDAILATNTSTLSIDEIAAITSRPEQVVGHHFFSPANIMQLLEIVRGEKTTDQVIATSMKLAKKLRKVGVLVGNCPGFVGNRMVGPYARESQFVAEEGALITQVDQALLGFGMAMGPLAMGDLAGVDVSYKVKEANKHLVPEGRRTPRMVDKLYELGRYGQKTGAGWYRYEAGSRKPIPDPEVQAMIEACSKEGGIERREVSDEEIVERTIYALINEGANILDEGYAQRAVDIDIIYVFGYGFPAYRGGPMFYADEIGLKAVYDRVCEFEKAHGDVWAPAPLLKRLAEEGKTFAEFDAEKMKQPAAV